MASEFTRALRIIRRTATGTADISLEDWSDALPTVLACLTRKRLPARRHRTCPRAVKRARHNSYRVKTRGGPASTLHNGPATILIHTYSIRNPRYGPRPSTPTPEASPIRPVLEASPAPEVWSAGAIFYFESRELAEANVKEMGKHARTVVRHDRLSNLFSVAKG